jgi:stage V sporulation protein S
VGAAAGQQAIKAVAVARGMVAPRGIDLSIVPGFCDIDMGDKVVTGITLKVIVG